MRLPRIAVRGPKFWAVTAAVTGLLTLSSALTFPAIAAGLFGDPWTDDGITLLRLDGLVFLIALGSGFLGLGTMAICGFREVGRLEVGGRLLPAWAIPILCGTAYGAPWVIAAALWFRPH